MRGWEEEEDEEERKNFHQESLFKISLLGREENKFREVLLPRAC